MALCLRWWLSQCNNEFLSLGLEKMDSFLFCIKISVAKKMQCVHDNSHRKINGRMFVVKPLQKL